MKRTLKPMSPKNNLLVMSALGKDRPGIIDRLSQAVFELECSIADSRMTVLGGEFAYLLMIQGPWNQLAKLEDSIGDLQKELSLTIVTKRTEERDSLGDLLPYCVDVVALDHPGIVHRLANFFSAREINIENMETDSYAAAHTSTSMFNVHMDVGIPASVHIATFREEFIEFCDDMNLDATLEPAKN